MKKAIIIAIGFLIYGMNHLAASSEVSVITDDKYNVPGELKK